MYCIGANFVGASFHVIDKKCKHAILPVYANSMQ